MGNIYDNWDKMSKETQDKCKKVMDSYGENKWWESDDPLEIAMYQIFEGTLLVDFPTFHEGLEKLLDRPVWTHEMGINYDGLCEEARLGINRLKTGIGISDEQRQEAIKRSIEGLEKYCKDNNKQIFKVEIPEEKSDYDENGIDRSGEDGWLQ